MEPGWGGPHPELAEALALVELVASESPELLRFAVESLAASPARLALLELVELFDVDRPTELISRALTAVAQLDRLELHARRWKAPVDHFGEDALPAAVLASVARARADRWRRQGRNRPGELMRVDRRLREAARHERTANMVREFLADRERPDEERAERLVRDLLED